MLKMQMIAPTVEGERRRHVRMPLSRSCKIHEPQSGRYIIATTHDISTGGALIEVPRVLSLRPGETIHVGVAMKRRDALLRGTDMLKAAVTRALHTVDDRTMIGLQFDEPLTDLDATHRAADLVLNDDPAHASLRAAA